jgi:hypothetical protein
LQFRNLDWINTFKHVTYFFLTASIISSLTYFKHVNTLKHVTSN